MFLDWIGSAINAASQTANAAANFKYNQELAKQQNQYNIDMWKMQADYNSPKAQMQRLQDAGLNPNLMYGNGNTGNMSSAPQQVVPEAPDFSEAARSLAEAFNIEGLRKMRADRKKAQAEAKNAQVNAERNELELHADKAFSALYSYDYNAGKYVKRPPDADGTYTVISPSAYYLNRILEGNYNKAHLIPVRERLLDPQIEMLNYDRKFYPTTFWIGTAGKGVKAVSDLTGMLNPSRYLLPLGKNSRQFITPSGRVLSY